MDLELLKALFLEQIPFNKHLGLEVDRLDYGQAVVALRMQPHFIGDPVKKILHGGVISTLVDVTGGLTAFSVLEWPRESSINTIDLRVDYVRMGRGERFTCEGYTIRKGNRIVVVRCDLKGDDGKIVALGTASYNIFAGGEAAQTMGEGYAAKGGKLLG